MSDLAAPATLPTGRFVDLPERGRTFVRDTGPLAGRPDAPTLVMVHGWTATADLNFFRAYAPLSQHVRIIAPDLHGHGLGVRSDQRFTLESCADDVAAICAALGVERATILGYSMGGAVASLVWRRHHALVEALVLDATSMVFATNVGEEVYFAWLAALAAITKVAPRAVLDHISKRWVDKRVRQGWQSWSIEQIRRHNWHQVAAAGHALGRFDSRGWIGSLDVPCAVVIHTHDKVVPTARQRALAAAIPSAHVIEVVGGHDLCVSPEPPWAEALIAAIAATRSR